MFARQAGAWKQREKRDKRKKEIKRYRLSECVCIREKREEKKREGVRQRQIERERREIEKE